MVDTSNVFGNGKERRRSFVGFIATLVFVLVLVLGLAIGVTYKEYGNGIGEGPRTVDAVGSIIESTAGMGATAMEFSWIGPMAYAAEKVPAGNDVTFTMSKGDGMEEATAEEMLMMVPPKRIDLEDVMQYMEDGGDVPEELLERYAATSDRFKSRQAQVEEYKTDHDQVMQEIEKRKKLRIRHESAIKTIDAELDRLVGMANYIQAKTEQEQKIIAGLSENDAQTKSEDKAPQAAEEKTPEAGGDAGTMEKALVN